MRNPTHLSWVGATEREDGTPYGLNERRGFNVFIYPAGDSPAEVTFTATGNPLTNDYTMPIADMGAPLADGDWQLVITDVDLDGRESLYSLPIDITIDSVTAPKSPTGLLAS